MYCRAAEHTTPIGPSRNKLSSDPGEELLTGIKQIFTGVPNRSNIQKEALKCSEKIFKSYDYLHTIVLAHEAIIQRRWTAKNKKKRTELLLDAWPNMSPLHRPDFEAFLSESKTTRILNTKYQDAYMFPMINLEDLAKTRPLLLLLNARGRHHPAAFAMADARQTDIARNLKAVVPPTLDGHTMLFRNHTSPEKYGEIVSWKEEPRAQQWIAKGLEMTPGTGLQVLQVQQRLLDFLVKVCARILHDVDFSPDTLAAAAAALADSPAPVIPPSKEPLSLVHQRIELAYRLPSAIDLEWLESLFMAERDNLRDHIISLHEDPAYFADMLTQYHEHREELLKETDGSPGKFFAQPSKEIWARALLFLVNDAYGDYEASEIALERLRDLRKVYDRYSNHLIPSQTLPNDLRKACEKFYSAVEHLSYGGIEQFKMMWPTSPPMRPWFGTRTVNKREVMIEFKWGALQCPARKRLLMLIRMLWEGEESPVWGREILLDQLEYFLERDDTAKSYLSPHIASMISHLGVLVEGLRQVMLFQPWASTFGLSFEQRFALIGQEHGDRLEGIDDIHMMSFGTPIVELAIPTDGKFAYPLHRQHTREGVEAMRQAEANLDAFWHAVHKRIFPILDAHPNLKAICKLLGRGKGNNNPLIPHRTPPWSEEEDCQTSLTPKEVTQFHAFYYHDLERRTREPLAGEEGGIVVSPSGVAKRVKRDRVVSQPTSQPLQDSSSESVVPPSAPYTLAVLPRTLKVFRTIFFTPGATSHLGDIPWRDFVDALTAAGLQPQKLRGSAWSFSPPPNDPHLHASIHFHEPHPGDKLPFWIARRYGTRLKRLFGWHWGTFIAKKKEA
ncbi:unnamed protein product [Sympodiomycopsis kandeliae]